LKPTKNERDLDHFETNHHVQRPSPEKRIGNSNPIPESMRPDKQHAQSGTPLPIDIDQAGQGNAAASMLNLEAMKARHVR
jgi:hypothetical protein